MTSLIQDRLGKRALLVCIIVNGLLHCCQFLITCRMRRPTDSVLRSPKDNEKCKCCRSLTRARLPRVSKERGAVCSRTPTALETVTSTSNHIETEKQSCTPQSMASQGTRPLWISVAFVAAMWVCASARATAINNVTDDATKATHVPTTVYRPFRPWRDSGARAEQDSKVLVQEPLVNMQYHMGPVLTSAIQVYIIWYGAWKNSQKSIIRDFLGSISTSSPVPGPSVQQWWSTVQTYTDQTGANISASIVVAAEHDDGHYSHGKVLSRLTVQDVIRSALAENKGTLPVNTKGGLYMVLTGEDVMMQDYCRAVCGFHYFTFPAKVGYTLPYAWIGNSGKSCPETCAYPFAIPQFMAAAMAPLKSPNNDVGVDGMVSVIGHELAEISSNPLINAWYAGENPSAPNEIADLCEGMYGPGASGGYPGAVAVSKFGASYNMHGVHGRKFLVQWIWNSDLNSCQGPQ